MSTHGLNEKIIIVFIIIGVLLGCDRSETAALSSVNAEGNKESSTSSETAIYFPGGVGVDFLKAPLVDRVAKYQEKDFRQIRYEFDESINDVNTALSDILRSDGYSMEVRSESDRELVAIYRKAGVETLQVRYAYVVEGGLKRKTRLELSWFL